MCIRDRYMAFKKNKAVAIFSLEMSKEQLVNRLFSLESQVDAQSLRTGNMKDSDWEKLIEGAGIIGQSKLIIDDTPGISISELRSKCRKYKLEHGLDIIIIDYLQLMTGSVGRSSESRQQEVSDISRQLKGLARELNVPVVSLSQLSRAVDVYKRQAVINADDYYGVEAFKLIYDYLSTHADDDKYRYTMVGYHLANTVTDNGYVSRGVCETNENGELVSVTERTRIEKYNGGVAYTEDDGNTWVQVPDDTTVSMNMWGFTKSILEEIKAGFPAFLDKGLQDNPMKCEYFLPTVVSNLLAEDKATVSVLKSADKWYGVTYKEDKPVVVAAIQRMKDEGLYPQHLWEGK